MLCKFIIFFNKLTDRMLTPVDFIGRVFGKGNSLLAIITSTCSLTISFFYIYTLGSHVQSSIYPFEGRTIILGSFFNAYIISEYFDHLIISLLMLVWLGLSIKERKVKQIAFLVYGGLTLAGALLGITENIDIVHNISALMALPVIICLLLYESVTHKKILKKNVNLLYLNYLALLGISLGIIGIIISSAPIFAIPEGSITIHNFMYDIYLFFSIFSPLLLLLMIICFPIKLLIELVTKKSLRVGNITGSNSTKAIADSRTKFVFLFLFVLLSAAIALIPHQSSINKDSQQIGVDTDYYVRWINPLIQSKNLQEFLEQAFVEQPPAFHGDRPLTLIILFTIAKTLSNSVDLIYIFELLPAILGPALVVIVYFLTGELTSKNDTASLLASFITAVSFHMLIGIYAGYYANWLAIIFGYSSFVFLIRYLKKPSRLNLIIYSILLILLLFSHTYTWTIFILVMALFLVMMLKLKYYCKRSIIIIVLVVLSSIVIDVTRLAITGSSSGIERDIQVAKETIGFTQFQQRWSNLTYSTHIYVGGAFSNFIVFSLGLLWLFSSNMRDVSTIFLMIFLSVGIVPFLFGDYTIQNRIFYNIPFQIPAAIGLTYIRNRPKGTLVLLPICVWLVAISIRSVSNFYSVNPS